MAWRGLTLRKPKAESADQVAFSPPQTELDQNVRAILMQVVKHHGALTVPIVEIADEEILMWNLAERPDGQREVTVWWANGEGGNDG